GQYTGGSTAVHAPTGAGQASPSQCPARMRPGAGQLGSNSWPDYSTTPRPSQLALTHSGPRCTLRRAAGAAHTGLFAPPSHPTRKAAAMTPAQHRAALYLQDKHPLREGMEAARYAEQKGFEAVWQAESRLVRDAIVPMAAFAAVTERIRIGSGVINNWTRNIGLLAATFLTLDDLAPNRILCGIGAWW